MCDNGDMCLGFFFSCLFLPSLAEKQSTLHCHYHLDLALLFKDLTSVWHMGFFPPPLSGLWHIRTHTTAVPAQAFAHIKKCRGVLLHWQTADLVWVSELWCRQGFFLPRFGDEPHLCHQVIRQKDRHLWTVVQEVWQKLCLHIPDLVCRDVDVDVSSVIFSMTHCEAFFILCLCWIVSVKRICAWERLIGLSDFHSQFVF